MPDMQKEIVFKNLNIVFSMITEAERLCSKLVAKGNDFQTNSKEPKPWKTYIADISRINVSHHRSIKV